MTTGLDMFRERSELRLHRLLPQPFRRVGGDYAINRHPQERSRSE